LYLLVSVLKTNNVQSYTLQDKIMSDLSKTEKIH
jgi:hypothetical protein